MKIKDYMLDVLVKNFDDITCAVDPDGRVLNAGGKYTIFNQCTGFYYAILYTYNHPKNPYFHKKELLDLSMKCWDSFIKIHLNDDGSLKLITFDKYWYDGVEEWCTLELINTLELLKDVLPKEKFDYYTKVSVILAEYLKKSVLDEYETEEFRTSADARTVKNHFLWSVVCVYKYAITKGDIALQEKMKDIIFELLDKRMPFGVWLEAGSLVIDYAYVSYGAISLFASYYDRDNEKILNALRQIREYLENCSYDYLENMGCIDIRNRFGKNTVAMHISGVELDKKRGEVFFTKHLEKLSDMPETIYDKHQNLGFFCLSFQSIEGGEIKYEEESKAQTIYIDKLDEVIPEYSKEKLNTIVIKENGFSIPFCILTQKSFNNRWSLERQNLISVYHKEKGLILGGGHSISDPSFSCFNVITDGCLSYLHSEAKFISDKKAELIYNNTKCLLEITEITENNVTIKYSAENLKDTDRVLVNIPVFANYIDSFSFDNITYDTTDLCAFGKEIKKEEKLTVCGTELSLTKDAFLKYPVFAFNPYVQVQEPAKSNAFIVLTAELTYDKSEVELKIDIN